MIDVFIEVRDMLVFSLMVDERQVSRCSRLLEDLGVDTTDLYEFGASCEDEFGIEIPQSSLEGFVTVGDAVRFIEARMLARPTASVVLAPGPAA